MINFIHLIKSISYMYKSKFYPFLVFNQAMKAFYASYKQNMEPYSQ